MEEKPTRPNILAKRSFPGPTLISMLVLAGLAEVNPERHVAGESPVGDQWVAHLHTRTHYICGYSWAMSSRFKTATHLLVVSMLCLRPGHSLSFHLKVLDACWAPPASSKNPEGSAKTLVICCLGLGVRCVPLLPAAL